MSWSKRTVFASRPKRATTWRSASMASLGCSPARNVLPREENAKNCSRSSVSDQIYSRVGTDPLQSASPASVPLTDLVFARDGRRNWFEKAHNLHVTELARQLQHRDGPLIDRLVHQQQAGLKPRAGGGIGRQSENSEKVLDTAKCPPMTALKHLRRTSANVRPTSSHKNLTM